MKQLQIRAQFRFNDGDKTKKPYKWEAIPADDNGVIEDGTYEPRCVSTGGQKAVDYQTIELPDTDAEFAEIPTDVQHNLIVEALVSRAKKKQADALREAYETPTQRANREKREAAAKREYLGEMMEAWNKKHPNEMPPLDLFQKWQVEAQEAASK